MFLDFILSIWFANLLSKASLIQSLRKKIEQEKNPKHIIWRQAQQL